MIFKSTQIVWKLKKGTVLKYGPKPTIEEIDVTEESDTEETKSSEEKNLVESTQSVVSNDVSKDDYEQESWPENASSAQIHSSNIVNEISANSNPMDSEYLDNEVNNYNNSVNQSIPDIHNNQLFNPSSAQGYVDGVKVDSDVTPHIGARWMSLPYRLRPKRADIFVDMQSSADYLSSLVSFLRKKGLDVKEYNDEFHYLPSDILLVDSSRIVDAGTVLFFQNGKREIWNALLREFGEKLNDK